MSSIPGQNHSPFHVCLVLEGAPRFAPGSISPWVRQIAAALPEVTFSLHYCGECRNHPVHQPDPLPGNISSVTTSHRCEAPGPDADRPGTGSAAQKTGFFRLVRSFLQEPDPGDRLDALCRAAATLQQQPGMFTRADLLTSSEGWQLLMQSHEDHAPGRPLVDIHATACSLASELWSLLRTAPTLPEADLYHAIGAGPIALLGAVAARMGQAPLILSGQGPSLEERIESIRRSHRNAAHPGLVTPFHGDPGVAASLETAFCELLTSLALHQASDIIAISAADALTPLRLGANPGRVRIIPRGIDSTRFTSIAREKLQDRPPGHRRITVGFLGRLVPTKDLKTLLRAARIVLKSHPETRFLLAGSTDADPAYFADCRALADQLGIAPSVEFAGPAATDEFLMRCDIVAITSLSDTLPLILLEASASGTPVVATDVGACRQVLINPLPSHPTLGPAGIITELADPSGTAAALNRLIANRDLRFELGMNGLRRVQSAYRHEEGLAAYLRLYRGPAGRTKADRSQLAG